MIKRVGDKTITVADSAGFCFGVKRAIKMAEQASADAKAAGTGIVYSLGPLIHNDNVVKEMERKGVHVIDNIEEAEPGATVIIRSHGEPRSTYEIAAEMGINIIDATCPFV